MTLALHAALALFAFQDGIAAAPPTPPIGADAVKGAVRRGVALLIERQEGYDPVRDVARRRARNGETPAPEEKAATIEAPPPREWPYEGVYRVGGALPIGYRVGGTAIAALALLEAGEMPKEGGAALDRALDFVLEGLGHELMNDGFVGGYDTRGWGHAYALGYLLRLRELGRVPEARAAEVEAAIDGLVSTLAKTAIGKQGGGNYSRGQDPDDAEPSSFMTAPTLQFLFEAARLGETVDAAVVERALDVLMKARQESGAFQYSIDPEHQTGKGFEAVEGAIGRTPACEVTLYLAGRSSLDRIRSSLEQFFAHWEWLEKRRKQTGTHVPPFMIAPYYFFYAHRHAAQAIELLPEAERPPLREKLVALLWKVREEDGGWNDRAFPRSECFGTAMTMLALLSPKLPPPARWAGDGAAK